MSSPRELPICAGRLHLGGTMALSGAAAQAATFHRDARSQAQQNTRWFSGSGGNGDSGGNGRDGDAPAWSLSRRALPDGKPR